MDLLGNSLDPLIFFVFRLLEWGLILFILVQMLIQFEIIPCHNQPARQFWGLLARLYDPLLAPLRRFLPYLGGFDLSPLVLIFILVFLRYALTSIF